MDFLSIIIIVIGLCVFETVSSIDNAIINADVLRTMSKKARRWFLLWGILFAVFVVRGILPWMIVWATAPELGFIGSFTASFSNDPHVLEAIERSAPMLLAGGGTFLVMLFFYWLFIEPKHYGLPHEVHFHKRGVWFYTIAAVVLTGIVWFALKKDPFMAFGAVVGSTAFFITHGFKHQAEHAEASLTKSKMSDLSKIMYLEVIDLTFSIDGVLGAFAFTLSVPLILLGNGLGAIVVRQLTVGNIERVKKYKYLKNGAMYSILFLGGVMLFDAFGVHIPFWVSPLLTFGTIGFFFWKSNKELKASGA